MYVLRLNEKCNERRNDSTWRFKLETIINPNIHSKNIERGYKKLDGYKKLGAKRAQEDAKLYF